MSFTNIFGYRRTTGIGNYNVDGLPLLTSTGNPEIGLPAGVRLTFINGGSISRVEQFPDEIQLKGDAFGARINWLLGGFYLKRWEEHSVGKECVSTCRSRGWRED